MCCLGVLNYHVIDDILEISGGETHVLYYGSSFCIPGFFLMTGYLLANKNGISQDYFERKVKNIIFKLFGWIIFWSVIRFMYCGELTDIWNEFLLGANSAGILAVSWFLFTYSVIMIFAYPILCFCKKYCVIFNIITICWMVLIACGIGKSITYTRTQALWLHMYIGYFMVGVFIHNLESRLEKNNLHLQIICFLIIVVTSVVYGMNWMQGAPHWHYGRWYYTIWLVAIFLMICNIAIKNEFIKRVLKRIGENTFVVYLGHLPILLFITSIHPLQNITEAICVIIFLFVVLNVLAEVFRRLPLLRKLV